MSKQITPIFLLSLPRSGSTLLQRMLGSHSDISTQSEPWFLLPLLYGFRKEGCYAEYGHNVLYAAVADFIDALAGGRDDYQRAIRIFATDLYKSASQNHEKYFLDKTPRYHNVSKELIETFPQAKFIFLWRHPLAVAASMLETWAAGKWKLYTYKVDLYSGLDSLIKAYKKNQNISIAIQYEALIRDPEQTIKVICKYLDLPFQDNLTRDLSNCNLTGSLGDPVGVKKYNKVEKVSEIKWHKTFSNPIRKYWCIKYLNWIGQDNLKIMGYNLDNLIDEVNNIPKSRKYFFSDLYRVVGGWMYNWLEPAIFRDKWKSRKNPWKVNAHR